MADISQIKLPDGTTYNLKDSYVRTNYRALNNNDFDTINVTELNAGDLIVTGAARFLNTINGSISGNAETATSATSATKATQDSDGNAINTTYLKKSGGTVTGQTTFNTSIHDAGGQTIFAGGATSSAWYKITLATNGITPPSSQQWYMCSMTIHVGGSYGNAAKGIIEVSYYIHWTGTAFEATNVYATAIGNYLNNMVIYYKLTDPFVIYVNVANNYTSLWVDKVSYRDSSYAYRANETKVEVCSAITTTDYSQIPIAKVYSTNGNNIFLNNSTFPSSNNSYNLGDPSYKWANVYATNFKGNNITLSTTSGISYEGTKNTCQMIRFIDNTNDAYGNGIAIGGGGQTIIGGGESASVMVSNAGTSGEEIMYVGNDQNVVVFTGLQNGWDSKKTFTFDTAGALTATKFIGALQGNADTATKANILNGFNNGGAGNITWGNQTGTGIWYNNDVNGGSVGFRTNNPTSGQVSMIIDGTVYIKEGAQDVAAAVKSFSVSGQTVTYTNLWGGTGTFSTQDTKNTAGSTDTSSKIFLIGATSQAANPQTYSDNEVYATNGVLTTKSVQVGGGSATMQYNTTTKSIDFVFAS